MTDTTEDNECACGRGEAGTVTFSAHLSHPDLLPFRRRRVHETDCCRDEPDEYGADERKLRECCLNNTHTDHYSDGYTVKCKKHCTERTTDTGWNR